MQSNRQFKRGQSYYRRLGQFLILLVALLAFGGVRAQFECAWVWCSGCGLNRVQNCLVCVATSPPGGGFSQCSPCARMC